MTSFANLKHCVKWAMVLAGVILSTLSIFVGAKHVWAEHLLDVTDFQLRTTSGATFFAAPKKLFVGQRVTMKALTKYLDSIGFTSTKGLPSPGSYELSSKRELTVAPRFPEFRRVRVNVKGGRISSLAIAPPTSGDFESSAEASIEPEILGSFVEMLNGNDRDRMFVKRQVVSYNSVAHSDALWALLASEDRTFFEHNGTRFDRLLTRLLPGNRGGGSSITTQTVKNSVSLQWRHSIGRKVDEVFLASALEQRMSKADIITLYMNNVFLGGGPSAPNVYGFAAAAEQYFGRDLESLTLSEASALVAMLPRPNYFLQQVRHGNYEALRQARDRVLDRMLLSWPDKYSQARIVEAKDTPLVLVEQSFRKSRTDALSAAFVDLASRREPWLELSGLPPQQYSGLHLFTSLDLTLATAAQEILDTELPELQRRFPPLGGGACSASDDRLLGAIVAIDPRTGAIVAASGSGGGPNGVDFAKLALNATAAPASSIKPFWTALALEKPSSRSGLTSVTAAAIVPTERGPQRLRSALAWSSDELAQHLMSVVGVNRAASFFESVTGKHPAASSELLALGFGRNTEISPLTWARAYSALVSGRLPDVSPISTVYLDGRELKQRLPELRLVLDPGAAFITTDLLRSAVGVGVDGRHGTAGRAAYAAGIDVSRTAIAGKTGSGPHAVWMTSLSPRLAVVVLLTYRCHSDISEARTMMAAETAAPIWGKFIAAVSNSRPDLLYGSFDQPGNVILEHVDPRLGCRTSSLRSISEYFLVGTEPSLCEPQLRRSGRRR